MNGNSSSGWRRICCDAALPTDAERTVRGCGGILQHLVNALLGAGAATERDGRSKQESVRGDLGSDGQLLLIDLGLGTHTLAVM